MVQEDDICIFVQPDRWINGYGEHEIYQLFREKSSFELSKNSASFLTKMRVIASSNGLILCQSMNGEGQVELCLCNPITQTWLSIATPTTLLENPCVNINVFFKRDDKGMDEDDYLMFLIEYEPELSSYVNVKVYLPKEGVWEAKQKAFFVGGMSMRLDMPLYLHGALHVISNCHSMFEMEGFYSWPYIMTYNFESGESTMLTIPNDMAEGPQDYSCDMCIFEWGKKNSLEHSMCLVKCIKDVFTIWVLVDYKSNTWRRILEKRVKEMGVKEEDPNIKGFRIINGDCLIFATNRKVYGYGYIGKNSWRLKEICEHKWDSKVVFTPYFATLQPCGRGASTIPLI